MKKLFALTLGVALTLTLGATVALAADAAEISDAEPVGVAVEDATAGDGVAAVTLEDLLAPEAVDMMGQGCQGPPDPDCVCPLVFDPVCGCDGETYSNSCFARCAGIRHWTEGACE